MTDNHASNSPPTALPSKTAKYSKTVQLGEDMYFQIEKIMQKEQRSFNWVATRLLQLALERTWEDFGA